MTATDLTTPDVSYCIDANYWKGTTLEDFIKKKRRQLVTEEITMIGGLQKHQTPRSDGICPCVNSAAGMGGGQTPIVLRRGYRVRRLTPKECWRLMGFTDEDFQKAQTALNHQFYGGRDRSGTQLYKQAGNSIVVDVLSAIFRNLYDAMPYLFEDMQVGSFFSGVGAFEKSLSTFDQPVSEESEEPVSSDLNQLGTVSQSYGLGSRVYDADSIACCLNSNGGGGGVRTGWYRVTERKEPNANIPEAPRPESPHDAAG